MAEAEKVQAISSSLMRMSRWSHTLTFTTMLMTFSPMILFE
jgi:hypothetical protein